MYRITLNMYIQDAPVSTTCFHPEFFEQLEINFYLHKDIGQ